MKAVCIQDLIDGDVVALLYKPNNVPAEHVFAKWMRLQDKRWVNLTTNQIIREQHDYKWSEMDVESEIQPITLYQVSDNYSVDGLGPNKKVIGIFGNSFDALKFAKGKGNYGYDAQVHEVTYEGRL